MLLIEQLGQNFSKKIKSKTLKVLKKLILRIAKLFSGLYSLPRDKSINALVPSILDNAKGQRPFQSRSNLRLLCQ